MFILPETELTFSEETEEGTSLKALQYSLSAQPPRATSQVSIVLLGQPLVGFGSRNPQKTRKTV